MDSRPFRNLGNETADLLTKNANISTLPSSLPVLRIDLYSELKDTLIKSTQNLLKQAQSKGTQYFNHHSSFLLNLWFWNMKEKNCYNFSHMCESLQLEPEFASN